MQHVVCIPHRRGGWPVAPVRRFLRRPAGMVGTTMFTRKSPTPRLDRAIGAKLARMARAVGWALLAVVSCVGGALLTFCALSLFAE